MKNRGWTRNALLCGVAGVALATAGFAEAAEAANFDIAPQPLSTALAQFGVQSQHGVFADSAVTERKLTRGVSGDKDPELALNELLAGTGLSWRREGQAFVIVDAQGPQSGSAAGGGAEVDALIVTAQKREEDIQDVPIAISAFTQEQLETHQIAGGPDLMTQIPNMTFTKTNFSSYSIQIRGIGTQAISATVDPAVAVAFNNTPFIRNRFFEQEFYDLQRVEVLRGPQGTLYGRNATAGVVNIISQKPKFDYEAKLSADIANYNSTRLEGMLNIPLAENVAALRVAGAWTKREGYSTNEITGNPIDGRDLWSTRVSLRLAPADGIDVNLIWEHFEEDDDRLRSGKQVCKRHVMEEIGGVPIPYIPDGGFDAYSEQTVFSQGCLPASMYAAESYQAPNGYALPYYHPLSGLTFYNIPGFDPYQSVSQSPDLRVIESTFDPEYRAKADIFEVQASVDLGDALTLSSETAYSTDRVFSFQDYNRFNTREGAFRTDFEPGDFGYRENLVDENGVFCDPQLGCASRVVAGDVSTAKSVQFSQELRLASNYDGPFNFSLGANYLRYDTEDKYYVFINTITLFAAMRAPGVPPWEPGVSDNHECMRPDGPVLPDPSGYYGVQPCTYIDPNPISSLNDEGHNYFLSKNPYKLISYAVFGEAYYNITENLKLTAGLRWTVDKKDAPRVPSWIAAAGAVGYSVAEVVEQEWREPTGRLTLDWKPDLGFTDETLLYASYAHGYKAGGANPPRAGAVIIGGAPGVDVGEVFVAESKVKPKTFDPEFVDAFELGSKNTFADGRVTLNLAAFYYDYKAYQISYIADRSAVNLNFDTEVWGLEVEADWRPLENLRLGFKGGYEDTKVADGSRAIDVMDRTAGREGWVVSRPHPTLSSNCVLPVEVVLWPDGEIHVPGGIGRGAASACEAAWLLHYDPYTVAPYQPFPFGPGSYAGYDPTTAPPEANNGEGFFKDLSGNELPNAPHFTATITADYTIPLPQEWLATLHADFYYQSEAWTRIFNTEGYDKLKAYTNVNLAAIFTNEALGWKVMAYIKNVMDRDSITGAFLNSDDTGLTTNVFLTEPRLFGLRVTKEWTGGPWWTGANPNHTGPYPLTVELGGQVQRHDAPYETVAPTFDAAFPDELDAVGQSQNRDLDWGDGRSVKVTWRPDSGPWKIAAGVRYGRTNGSTSPHRLEQETEGVCAFAGDFAYICPYGPAPINENGYYLSQTNFSRAKASNQEQHDIVDFSVGRDVALGTLESSISAGLRFARFDSTTKMEMLGTPDWFIPQGWFMKYESTHTDYEARLQADREFEGVGPTLAWESSVDLIGDDETGRLSLDWAVGGGVLFGKQKTSVQGTEKAIFYELMGLDSAGGYDTPIPNTPGTVIVTDRVVDIQRSDSITAPLVDLSLGLSYEVGRLKVGAGYRWERYFDVLDVGNAKDKDGDRTIDGPFLKLSVGFGG